MKIAEFIIEFIFGMFKRAVTLATIGVIILLTVWIFTVLMPEEAMNALGVFKDFVSP